jgi:hypothetical protein
MNTKNLFYQLLAISLGLIILKLILALYEHSYEILLSNPSLLTLAIVPYTEKSIICNLSPDVKSYSN